MRELNQLLLDFDIKRNFNEHAYYVSDSNYFAFNLINKWPKWEKKILNISGEKFSGKTHLVNIFLKKYNGYKLDSKLLNNSSFKEIKLHQNIILENLNENIDEILLYTLINTIEQDNKYLIITSQNSIVDINFELNDLKSRSKNFLLVNISKPDDDLVFALILKNLSDRQISLDKKLISYITKRIDRSYSKIFDFIYKIDEISLKKKKSIDLKIIKEALED